MRQLREIVICSRSHSYLGAKAELEPWVGLIVEALDILPPAWDCGMGLGNCRETISSPPGLPWSAEGQTWLPVCGEM